MKTKKEINAIIQWFQTHMPHPESELHYQDPYSLIVAVILSAQCTDKRVNLVTPAFWALSYVDHLASYSGRSFPLYQIRNVSQQQSPAPDRHGTAYCGTV